MRPLRIAAILLCSSVVVACGQNGTFGTNPAPDGNIQVQALATPGAGSGANATTPPLITSASSPYLLPLSPSECLPSPSPMPGGGQPPPQTCLYPPDTFTLYVREGHFNGQFKASVIQWHNGTTVNCFIPTLTTPFAIPNIFTFNATNET